METPYQRDTALDLSRLEIDVWAPRTQAIAEIGNAHFDVFNQMERAAGKRERNKLQKALGTLYRAAEHLQATPD